MIGIDDGLENLLARHNPKAHEDVIKALAALSLLSDGLFELSPADQASFKKDGSDTHSRSIILTNLEKVQQKMAGTWGNQAGYVQLVRSVSQTVIDTSLADFGSNARPSARTR